MTHVPVVSTTRLPRRAPETPAPPCPPRARVGRNSPRESFRPKFPLRREQVTSGLPPKPRRPGSLQQGPVLEPGLETLTETGGTNRSTEGVGFESRRAQKVKSRLLSPKVHTGGREAFRRRRDSHATPGNEKFANAATHPLVHTPGVRLTPQALTGSSQDGGPRTSALGVHSHPKEG